MSEDQEPFFTPAELRAITLFRPSEWRRWWKTEPAGTKLIAIAVVLALGAGTYDLLRGNRDSGWIFLAMGGVLSAIVVVIALLGLLSGAIRWVFRITGIRAMWRKVRVRVLAIGAVVWATTQVMLWIGLAVVILVLIWPYLSLSPVKSWYALRNGIPAARVEIEKVPHDCDFDTAPLGKKNCHYEARVEVFKGTVSAGGDGTVLVTYEKVDD